MRSLRVVKGIPFGFDLKFKMFYIYIYIYIYIYKLPMWDFNNVLADKSNRWNERKHEERVK